MSASRPGRAREARESPSPREGTTLPASGCAPEEGNMLGDQPAAVRSGRAEAAFRSLYAEHGPALLRLATALTDGDRGRAEDLVQETMLRAWTHRGNVDIQHRSPRAWLATTARRLAVDAHRARRARPQEAELHEDLGLTAGQRADAGIDQADVRAAIAALPGAQREVLTEVYYRDRSVAETARILQIPPGTVQSRTFYGLRALRRALAADDAMASPRQPRRRPGIARCWSDSVRAADMVPPARTAKAGVSRGMD
jgi:RNA polymerase sigma-70 factor, ECF subfamily